MGDGHTLRCTIDNFRNPLKHELPICLGVFATVLIAMALWEAIAPRRVRSFARAAGWPANLGTSMLDSLVIRILLPLGAVGFVSFCIARQWGLLSAIALPKAEI
jgi:hypothetical protein